MKMRRSIGTPMVAFWFTLLIVGSYAAQAPATEAPEEGYLGVWRNIENPSGLVRFEPNRFTRIRKGQPEFFRMSAEEGRVVLERYARRTTLEVSLPEEDRLVIHENDRNLEYSRVDGVPDALVIVPLELGRPTELEPLEVTAIRDDLLRRRNEDQAVRVNPERKNEMASIDTDNTAWIIDLVRRVGWIDATRFGPDGTGAAFLIVQHSMDMPLMLAVLPEIEKDVRAGRADSQNFALLDDRIRLHLGYRQKYGSQITRDEEGRLVIQALEEPERVEEIRKEIGLFSLEMYLGIIEKQTGEKVIFMDAVPAAKAAGTAAPEASNRAATDAASRWNRVFREETPRHVTDPSKFLTRCVDRVLDENLVPRGANALVLAMGDGRNALYLADRGFDVTGLDVSDVAIAKAKKAAADRGLELTTLEADLFEHDLGDGEWDLVTNIYFNPAIRVLDRIRDAVRPGGILLIEGYGADHKGSGPPEWSRYKKNQLLEELQGWRILEYDDGVFEADWAGGRSAPVVRILAQKPE